MRRAVLVLLPLLVVFFVLRARMDGVPPKPASAPANEFSAERAQNVLRGLLAEGVPHPIGSAANARVRERIEAQFRALGYDVRVHRRFVCSATPTCATVENVLATQPGAPAGAPVLLSAHYDSVAAGSGASDDCANAAALIEVARALKGQRFRNPIAFLITDGEEAGLLGAAAYAADGMLGVKPGVVVNFENRGTAGPSYMFETSQGNRWLIEHVKHVPAPVATSLFFAVYERMPNDTDVTIYKHAGVPTVNFAAIRNVAWYHTALDDLQHVDARTVQHHGEHALAMAREFGNADLHATTRDNASYFDVAGFFLLAWPEPWNAPIAIVSAIVLIIAAVRRRQPLGRGFVVFLLTIVAAGIAGFILGKLASMRGGAFLAHPGPAIAAMWLVGFAAAVAVAALAKPRRFAGIALAWHVLAIAVSFVMPGAAYLFVVPALALTLCVVFNASDLATSTLSALAASFVLFPLGLVLYEALGALSLTVIAVFMAMFFTLIAPVMPRMSVALLALFLAIVGSFVALGLPPWTTAKPHRIPVAYVLDDNGAHWATTAIAPKMSNAVRFEPHPIDPGPWRSLYASWTAEAPALAVARVEMEASRSGNAVRVHVHSARNAERVRLFITGEASAFRINGMAALPPVTRFDQRHVPQRMIEVYAPEATIEMTAAAPLELIAGDFSSGVPAEGAALRQARDAAPGTPVYEGDATVTMRRGKV